MQLGFSFLPRILSNRNLTCSIRKESEMEISSSHFSSNPGGNDIEKNNHFKTILETIHFQLDAKKE